MRLLIVDSDVAVRRLVSHRLSRQGINVVSAATGPDGLTQLRRATFDVAILDLTLPDGSGFELLRFIRQLEAPTHVIILSEASAESDRVRALELGADDYVVKPFFVRELAARVLAVGRHRDVAQDNALRHGRLVIDLARRQAAVDQVAIDLTVKEFDLLAFLAARPGHVFSRTELLRSLWPSDIHPRATSTVTQHVGRLRAKIELDPRRPALLITVLGAGYRFDPPPPEQFDLGVLIPGGPSAPGNEGILVLVEGRIVAVDEAAIAMMGVDNENALIDRELQDLASLFHALLQVEGSKDTKAAFP